jgi:hypothetical protein
MNYSNTIEKDFMEKLRKKALRLLLVVALGFNVALGVLCVPVQASGYYVVNCMVACDDDWNALAGWLYGYSGGEFAAILFDEATYYFWANFSIDFRIRAWATWDSADDPATDYQMKDEAVDETGFTAGMTINGDVIHCLIAFTNEGIPGGHYGVCFPESAVILVQHYITYTQGQHTDNILQHELTHFYGVAQEDEHRIPGLDCVMNIIADVWCPFPDHHFIRHCMVTHTWCDVCFDTVSQNRGNLGYWIERSGGGGQAGDICAWAEHEW